MGVLQSVLAAGLLILGWESLARSLPGDGVLMATFTGTVQAAIEDRSLLMRSAIFTSELAIKGLLLGFLAGTVLATVAVTVARLRGICVRLATAVFVIPLVTLAPVFQLAFGPDGSRIALSMMAVSFVYFISVFQGLSGTPPALADLATSMGSTRARYLLKVRLWWAVPQVMSATRIAGPAALLGAMLAEYFGAERGVGAVMLVSIGNLNVERAYAIAAIIILLSGIWYLLVQSIGRLAFPWLSEFTPSV